MVDRHEGGRGKERAIIGESVGVTGEELIIYARAHGNNVCPIEEEEDNEYPHEFPGASFHVFLTFTNFCVCGHRMKVDEQVFALITALLVGVVTAFISNKTGADGLSPSASDRRVADEMMYLTKAQSEFANTLMLSKITDFLFKEGSVIQSSGGAASKDAVEKFEKAFPIAQSMIEKARDLGVKDRASEKSLQEYYPALGYDPNTDAVQGMKAFDKQVAGKRAIAVVDMEAKGCRNDEERACMSKLISKITVTHSYDAMVFFFPKKISQNLYVYVRSAPTRKQEAFIVGTIVLTPTGEIAADAECPFGDVYYVAKCPTDIVDHLNRGKGEFNSLLVTTADEKSNRYVLDAIGTQILAPNTLRRNCKIPTSQQVFGVFALSDAPASDGDRAKDGFDWTPYP